MSPTLPLALITAHHSAQPRAAIDLTVADAYAEAMREGSIFPPIVVYFDGETHWLADGFHRLVAAQRGNLYEIAAEVRQGGLREAVLYSCGANAFHGVHRTNEDKRRAVERLISDPEWAAWGDRKVAEHCGVSHPFVAQVRPVLTGNITSEKVAAPPPNTPAPVVERAQKIAAEGGEPRYYESKHGSVAVMDVSRIGRKTATGPSEARTADTPAEQAGVSPVQPAPLNDDECGVAVVDLANGLRQVVQSIYRCPSKSAVAMELAIRGFDHDELALAGRWIADLSMLIAEDAA